MIKIVAAAVASGWGVIAVEEVLPSWAQAGILGLIILAFVTKQLVPGYLYQDAKAELKEQRMENARLVQVMLDNQSATLPALQASTQAVNEAMMEIKSLRNRR